MNKNKIFRKTRLKFTFSYLAVLMLLSILFSGAIYVTSEQKMTNSFVPVLSRFSNSFFDMRGSNYLHAIDTQVSEFKLSILYNLLLINAIVFVVGFLICYVLARINLKNIENSHMIQNEFIANASHELKTPLSIMRTQIEVGLETLNFNEEQKKLMQSNIAEIDSMNALVMNLLKLSRIESTKAKQEKFDIAELLQDMYEKFDSIAKEKEIQLFKEGIDGICFVRSDKELVKELITIFIDNAIKYTPRKKAVKISLRVRKMSVSVSVADTGIGIASSEQKKIFDRFYRVDKSHSTAMDGFGVGLPMAKTIADLLGTHIRLQSDLGKGSVFSFSLRRESK